MKTASNPDNPLEEICRQAAKVLAGEYWFPLSAQTKKLVIGETITLKRGKKGEPRGTERAMIEIAKLLPEDQRGEYKDYSTGTIGVRDGEY